VGWLDSFIKSALGMGPVEMKDYSNDGYINSKKSSSLANVARSFDGIEKSSGMLIRTFARKKWNKQATNEVILATDGIKSQCKSIISQAGKIKGDKLVDQILDGVAVVNGNCDEILNAHDKFDSHGFGEVPQAIRGNCKRLAKKIEEIAATYKNTLKARLR